ncbi:MAG TPA: TonB-dependent receptor [Verrucomicrobiae bacterium]|nr:TonB-dependent receptor [Verrucomicrobiae bacterium]
MPTETRTAQEKALRINLEARRFGTFAEIGAGQEVARWFFHAGKASATVAKSISAYDMSISDSLYGPAEHYVSRPRLEAMLDREFGSLVERVGATGRAGDRFFVYADTVATHGSKRRGDHGGHRWLGVRFQTQAGGEPSEIIAHIDMLDGHTIDQQQAVGLAGVNLVYGAFYHPDDPGTLIGILLDELGRERMEVDLIKFSGPAFTGVDNRLMTLQLVQQNLTDVATFTAAGEVVQSAETLSTKPVLMVRGRFRPITKVVMDATDRAREQFEEDWGKDHTAVVMEMTLNNLMSDEAIDHQDFLARVDLLGKLGFQVMISNYTTFDRVTQYLRQYTCEPVGMVMGIPTLRQVLDEKYYQDLNGGLLEGLGRLFSGPVKLLVYPTIEAGSEKLVAADTLDVPDHQKNLYAHLIGNGFIEAIRKFDVANLGIRSADVLAKLQAGDREWEKMAPSEVVRLIQAKSLFGYHASAPTAAGKA